MNLHDADIMGRLTPFLHRKQMRRIFEGNPSAQEAEVRALAAAIGRSAPRDPSALSEWWLMFEVRLSEICGAMWPIEKEIRDAAAAVNKARPQVAMAGTSSDPAETIAAKMRAGEPVGEGWLYGIDAVELAARQLIDRDTMTRYRSGAFLSRRAIYGEAGAKAWEADRLAAHESAKEVWRSREAERTRRAATIPDKTARPTGGFAA